MKLEQGNIVFFHYRNYHKDRNPLALILYVPPEEKPPKTEEEAKRQKQNASKRLVHCLNLHALTPILTDELIDVIAKIVGRVINERDTYKLYHDLFKRKLPGVLKYAYRTYKPEYIQSKIFISKGFETDILYKLRGKYTPEKIDRAKDRIKREISVTVNKEPTELLKSPPKEHRFKSVEDYIEQIKKIVPPKIDFRKYTGIRRKR